MQGMGPQHGMEHRGARPAECGIVPVSRELGQLHEGLIRQGAAHRFGEPRETPDGGAAPHLAGTDGADTRQPSTP